MARNTLSFDLEFLAPYPVENGGPLRHAIAHVMVKPSSHGGIGSPVITPDCVTLRELESEIERLHQELEEVRMEGKSKFARHDQLEERWRKNISQAESPLPN